MLVSPRKMVGTLGFVFSIAASSNISARFQSPPPLTTTVRTFEFPKGSLPGAAETLTRNFLLELESEGPDPSEEILFTPSLESEIALQDQEEGRRVVVNLTHPENQDLPPETQAEAPPEVPEVERLFYLEDYVPLPGDTLAAVALRLGCELPLLKALNPKLQAGHLPERESIQIYRGDVLRVEVQKGDTLWQISQDHKVTLREVVWLNHLEHLSLRPGQVVFLPKGGLSESVRRRASLDLRTSELLAKARKKTPKDTQKMAGTAVGATVFRPIRGRVSSGFGWRSHPLLKKSRFHKGVDIAAPKGTPIQSLYGGKVIFAGRAGAGGKSIILRHPNGLETVYAHCDKLLVEKGQKIEQGATIGKVGKTGLATAPHLHFAMRRGRSSIDPLPFLR